MTDYSKLSNHALAEQYAEAWRQCMYYAAAEGNWSEETKDREDVEARYYALQKEMIKRKLRL